jgi:NAD(P)-dependent dehydrogenase (short-subunit alcohol dehydrogenase family)
MSEDSLFNVNDQVIAITGGAGVLCSEMSLSLAARGAKIAVLDYNLDGAEAVCKQITENGGDAIAIKCNVLEKDSVAAACDVTVEKFGRVDALINGAGGNKKEATCVPPETTFFGLDDEAIRWVFDLNCLGTMLPCQVFGHYMADRDAGTILNISSMCGFRPLTRVVGYSAAKAAIANFTQWLSVYMAQNHSTNIRVNAIAPGFFLTEQNRFLLTNEDGSLTARGEQIIGHTPMGRFGEPDDLIGATLWLLSEAAKFVTGTVIPIDGGFNAYSGV